MRYWISIALFLFCSCKQSKSPIKTPPIIEIKRVITLTPSATELVVILGSKDKLVGRDEFSVEPDSILSLPSMGDFLTPNIESIASLKPDLVILDQSQAKTTASLNTLSISNIALRMHSLSDVRAGIQQIGEALQKKPQAMQLITQFDSALATYQAKAKKRTESPTVLAIIDRAPDKLANIIVAGPGTYLDELLTMVGAKNIMIDSSVPYPQVSAEFIIKSNPDIIIDLSKSKSGLMAYTAIGESSAMRNQRVHFVSDTSLLSPSPKVAQALQHLFTLTQK